MNVLRGLVSLASLALVALWVASVPAQEAPQAEADWSFLPSDAVGAVVIHPRRVLTAPEMEWMPVEVISAAGKQELGIDPVDVERAVGVLGPVFFGLGAPEPPVVAVVQLTKPYAIDEVLPQVRAQAVKETLDGRPYYRGQQSPSMSMPDDHTLIVGNDAMLRRAVQAKNEEGPLLEQVRQLDPAADIAVAVSIDAMREELETALQQVPPFPEPFSRFREAPNLLSAVRAEVSSGTGSAAELAFLARDDESAAALEALLDQAIALGEQAYLARAAEVEAEAAGDPVQEATAQYLRRIGDRLFQAIEPQREGRKIAIRVEAEQGLQPSVATTGMAVGLLLPAVQAAREAARRMESSNNLKELMFALHNYHDVHGRFPADITDDDGTPLLSWRVEILAYVDEPQLYDQFRLDEPWDSEHNRPLADQLPRVYINPNLPPGNLTNYLIPLADGGWASLEQRRLSEISDGASNTIALVEANAEEAVLWSKPGDLEVDLDRPHDGLGALRPGGFLTAFLDGSVRFIASSVDPEVLRALLTARGDEPVGDF